MMVQFKVEPPSDMKKLIWKAMTEVSTLLAVGAALQITHPDVGEIITKGCGNVYQILYKLDKIEKTVSK